MGVPTDDPWAEFDRAAAAHGLGAREIVRVQRVSLWRQGLIFALLTVLIVPVAIFLDDRELTLPMIVGVSIGTWLLIMAVIASIQFHSMRKRSLRMAQYQGGVVLSDGGLLHVARWDELTVEVSNERFSENVNLVFRTPQRTSVVSFGQNEWPQAASIGKQLQARTVR